MYIYMYMYLYLYYRVIIIIISSSSSSIYIYIYVYIYIHTYIYIYIYCFVLLAGFLFVAVSAGMRLGERRSDLWPRWPSSLSPWGLYRGPWIGYFYSEGCPPGVPTGTNAKDASVLHWSVALPCRADGNGQRAQRLGGCPMRWMFTARSEVNPVELAMTLLKQDLVITLLYPR